ncbi:ABC transporter substrate-binding protein [Clostridium sp. MSJ-4]|uniref:ABC transporter substrate-binding protein n=1 Tax=Clostridium simiarum TaxID=2841506 RepID=A0ABS6EXC1_9CLOT|nr:MqnA/MqnD/SBP family protein [Clostridium simiarum]MBU5590360.1 ABC transporter substrate-binding protein [Clostridium simiarum]
MKKRFSIALSLLMSMVLLVGCISNKGEEKQQQVENKNIKVFVPDGIPALTAAKLMKEKPEIKKNFTIEYNVEKTPDALVAKVLNSEADIAVVPSNLAAQAYNKNLSYKLAGTAGWGSLFVVTSEDISKVSDMKGKEIYNIGKGLTPDIIFRFILSKNNIDTDKDVSITYLNGATELAPAFISGKTSLAVMPEPMITTVTMKKTESKIAIDLNKEWINLTGSKYGYPQSSIIIKKELIEKNKDFVDKFLEDYKESIKWANENPQKLGEYAEELELNMNKATAEKVIERANMNFIHIKESKEDYETYYKVLNEFEPKSIGGKVPDEGLYMGK